MRFIFQAINEITIVMVVMTLTNNTRWGLALLLSLALSTIIWLFFTSKAYKNKLTFLEFRAGMNLNMENPDCCTLLMLVPLFILGPIYFFIVGFLALFELWELRDEHPQQYYYVNINFILKLVFLLPTGFLYLAFAVA